MHSFSHDFKGLKLLLCAGFCLLAACSSDPEGQNAEPGEDLGSAQPDASMQQDMSADLSEPVDEGTPPADLGAPDMPADLAMMDMTSPGDMSPGGRCPDAPGVSDPALEVATSEGAVRGTALGQDADVLAFLGVPFAAPPVGPLRWRAPEPASCRAEVFDASEFGARCRQRDAVSGKQNGEEDCLTINVFTPAVSQRDEPLPVLFYIHGGGNVQGASSETLFGREPLFWGEELARKYGVVVVTANYRLGPLGFLALPELEAESGDGSVGNYALRDQIAALDWTQEHVAAFGGDPARVMLFGESAGALNVCSLLASPLAAGKFSAALMESGGCDAKPKGAAMEKGVVLTGETPCKDAAAGAERLECMRGLDVAVLYDTIPGEIGVATFGDQSLKAEYGAVIDGVTLTDHPFAVIQRGEHHDVPFVIGANAAEMENFIAQNLTLTKPQYQALVRSSFATPALGQEALDLYPFDSYSNGRAALVDMLGDGYFVCPSHEIAAAAAAAHPGNVWRYYFSHRPIYGGQPLLSTHGLELIYVFDRLDQVPGFTPSQDDRELATQIQTAWTNLARDGVPTLDGTMLWPAYTADASPVLELRWPLEVAQEGIKPDKCDFWRRAVLAAATP